MYCLLIALASPRGPEHLACSTDQGEGPSVASFSHIPTWHRQDPPTPGINGTNDAALFVNQMFNARLSCTIPNVPAGT